VAASAIAFALLAGTFSGIKMAQGVFAARVSPAVGVTVPMRVRPGTSLWSLARRYGNPQKNIVDRVEDMASLNNMTTSDTLMPGQRLLVKVENPVEIAQLKQNVAVVASPIRRAH
jgi:LysM repeat protein